MWAARKSTNFLETWLTESCRGFVQLARQFKENRTGSGIHKRWTILSLMERCPWPLHFPKGLYPIAPQMREFPLDISVAQTLEEAG